MAKEDVKDEENLDDENLDDKGGAEGGKDESDKGSKDDNKGGKDDSDKGGSENGKTFTQEQVNKMMTREKNQGRNAALKDLGIDPKDSKAIKAIKDYIESQKTDTQKEAEAAAAKKESEQRVIAAEAKVEAMMIGVKPQFVDDVVTLAMSKVSDESSDLKTIIGEFKTKYPVWFGSEEEDDKDKGKGKDDKDAGKKGTGKSMKSSSGKDGEGEKNLGARLAAQRRASTTKKSIWGNKE